MLDKPRIFISYARADREKVKELYRRLSDEGFQPWLDAEDIIPGENWMSAIQKAIRNSDFFLACLSKNSVNRRGMIQKEIMQALDAWQEKLASDIYLIPVRLEDCEVPQGLQEFQWVDLFEKDGLPRLLMALKLGVARRAEVTIPKVSESVRRNKQAMVKRMRGLIAEQRNDLDRAEQNLQEALALWQELKSDKYIATALCDLGKIAQKRKKYDAAERFFGQSVELARKIDDKEVQIIGIGYQGQLAINTRKWTEARGWYDQSLELARKIGHVEGSACAQYGLACVHEAEGHTDLALPLAQEALKIYERLQHKDLVIARELVERLKKKTGSI